MARAVMEGVAYGLRDSLELLAALGDRPSVGRASGGGAASELWLRIVASALELRLERIEVEDGSAYGAALLAGVAAGVFADVADAASRCVRVTATIDPDDAWTDSYRDGYARFTRAYPAVRPL
jgi:xylulokinase